MTCIDGTRAHRWLVPSPRPDIGPFAEATCAKCGAVKSQQIHETIVAYSGPLAPKGKHTKVTAKRMR